MSAVILAVEYFRGEHPPAPSSVPTAPTAPSAVPTPDSEGTSDIDRIFALRDAVDAGQYD